MSNQRRPFVFSLMILIVWSVAAVLAVESAAQVNAAEVLELSITKLSAEPVPVGEPVRFGVKLRNISGQGVQNIVMQLKWDDDAVSDARMRIVTEETVDVITDRVRREPGMVSWKGDLKTGGVLSVEIAMVRLLCTNENISVALMAEAGHVSGGGRISASENISAACQSQLNRNDISVEMGIGFDVWVENKELFYDVLAGRPETAHLSVRNNSDGRINALIGLELMPKPGMEERCLLLPAVQQRFSGAPTIPVVNSFFGSDTFTYSFMALEIDPDTTWKGDLQLLMRGREPGCEFDGQMAVYAGPADPIPDSCQGTSPECRYQGWSPREKDVQTLVGNLPKWVSDPVTAVLVSPDLGDTPTSDNHFNIGMPPYESLTEQANFPTVFNFSIGLPPTANGVNMDVVGPYHRNARPFRLGALTSVERDADLNPGRNINPETGASNLDRRDDGLSAIEMPGSCEPLTMPVQITVEQWALDYLKDNGGKAYLNVFVDANGDGDWADAGQCHGKAAPEHVVINHSMDMTSARLGTFSVGMPVNPGINWETLRTWLRVSISEQPAPTPLTSGGISHGDGRGPENGYLLGETEDYRVRIGNQSAAMTQGIDLGVRLDGFLTVESILPAEKDLENVILEPLTATVAIFNHQVSFANLGDLPASQAKLVVMPDPALRKGEIEISVLGDIPWSGEENVSYVTNCGPSDPDCRVVIDLGSVPPGSFGMVNVTVRTYCDPEGVPACRKSDLVAKARVQTAGDGNGNNNESAYKWALPLFAEFMAPPRIDFPIPGTSSNAELEVHGVTWPGRTVIVGVDGKIEGEDVGGDGPWTVPVAPIDGNHRVAATYKLPGGKANPSAPVSVAMSAGSNMIIDPMSIRVEVQHGNDEYQVIPWDKNGRVDANGWQLPLIEGTAAEITIEPASWTGCLTCTFGIDNFIEPLTATLVLPGEKLLTTLTIDKDDGNLHGSFDVDSSLLNKPVSMNVYFEGLEQVYEGSTISVGELPKVIDGLTGQPVEGARVVLWQAANDGDVDGADFLAWQRSTFDNGQPNPRVTGSDGTFLFDVSPGRYRLEIIYDDNAPSVWTDMRPLAGIYPSRNIVIMPDSASPALSSVTTGETVSINEDGFSPPFVTVNPGAEIEFQNLDLQDRGAHATAETMALMGLNASHSDAPLIRPGDRFRIRFPQTGSYEFEDPQNPQNRITVVVEHKTYLPVLMQN